MKPKLRVVVPVKKKKVKVKAHERGESKKKEVTEELNANTALAGMYNK